jgi:hypothetical protein
MLSESEFDEVVLFGVAAEYADRFLARLAQDRLAWLLVTEDGFFVAASLRAESEDLARLLRDIETWIAESDPPYVRFILDGREYMLRAQVEAERLPHRPFSSS